MADWLELFSYFATSIGIITAIIAAVFAAHQINEASNTRRATLYGDIRNRWLSEEMTKSRLAILEHKDFYDKNKSSPRHAGVFAGCTSSAEYFSIVLKNLRLTDRSLHTENIRISVFLEDIGVLCRKGLARPADIFDLMGSSIIFYSELYMPYMLLQRGNLANSTYANALWLYNQAKAAKKFSINQKTAIRYAKKP